MSTITRPAKDAQFYTNMSNARRALKKLFPCSTEVANALLHQEAFEEGGRIWFSPAEVNRMANPQVELDKATPVPAEALQPAKPATTNTAPTTRANVRNGVRRPGKGKCADVWAALDKMNEMFENSVPTIGDVRELAKANGWNMNNATIEFYNWRKWNGLNGKK